MVRLSGFEIVAQLIGIIAMAFNILSYQGKKQSTVILLQLMGSMLFATNYLMLGATIGGILNIIGMIRAIVFLYKDKLKTYKLSWLILFICSYVIVYVLNFTVFDKKLTVFNLVIELLPVIGMTALSVGYRLERAADVRKCGMVSAPSWLIYNIVVGSWGATICEMLTIISIFVAFFRYDREKKCGV